MFSTATDPATGSTYLDFYDVFTVGAGYVDIAAALTDYDVATRSAVSPSAHFFPFLNEGYLTIAASSLWNSTSAWSTGAVWGGAALVGGSAIWNSGAVWGSSGLWGTAVSWGTGGASGTAVSWGTGGDSGTTVSWGTSGTGEK